MEREKMKLKPILTEKSIAEAKEGRYTFVVPVGMRKLAIAKLVGTTFGVKVTKVRTVNYKPTMKMSMGRRKKAKLAGAKKAVVSLAGKDKIEVFGERKAK